MKKTVVWVVMEYASGYDAPYMFNSVHSTEQKAIDHTGSEWGGFDIIECEVDEDE